jgi:AraC-like DNA-binding protein
VSEIVALVLGRELQARLREGLRARAPVRFISRCREVAPAVASADAAAVILELRDADGLPTAPTIRQLRQAFPGVPVLALCPVAQPSAQDLLAAAQAGVSGLILRDVGDAGSALREALDHADDDCTARRVLAELGDAVATEALPILEFCLTRARYRLTVEDVAAALGMHRKTLLGRLARAGLPAPLALIGWCRLLLAARLMQQRGRALEQIALQLDFPSGASLRNMLARYTGLKANAVRDGQGFERVLAAFRGAIGSPPARLGGARSTPTGVGSA